MSLASRRPRAPLWLIASVPVALMIGPASAPATAQSVATHADAWTETEGRLVIDLPNATVQVRGGAHDSVHFEIRAPSGAPDVPLPVPRRVGTEIRLVAPGNTTRLTVIIRVPHEFEATIRGSNGGPMEVEGLHGALTIENSNAGIHISGARNALLASTSNGPITARFEALPADAPVSFITSNDSVSVTLPGGSGAALHLETDNGRITSEFDLELLPGPRPIPTGAPRGPSLRAEIGGGGSLIRIRTDNGDIHVRRAAGPGP